MIFVKFIVLLLLAFVIISLFSGLYFLVKDKGQSNRTVNALSVRIGLSIVAIVIVIIAGLTGVLEMNPSPFSVPPPASAPATLEQDIAPGGGRRPVQPDGS
ncbi:MAG: twin transmembrane helix small protein [Granulosicoccus sp.]